MSETSRDIGISFSTAFPCGKRKHFLTRYSSPIFHGLPAENFFMHISTMPITITT